MPNAKYNVDEANRRFNFGQGAKGGRDKQSADQLIAIHQPRACVPNRLKSAAHSPSFGQPARLPPSPRIFSTVHLRHAHGTHASPGKNLFCFFMAPFSQMVERAQTPCGLGRAYGASLTNLTVLVYYLKA
jgi:hypothetical protein